MLKVGAVNVGDFVFAACAGLEVAGNGNHVVVVEVQAGHGPVRARLSRLFFNGQGLEVSVELHHAVIAGVGHLVGKDHAAVGLGVAAQARTHAGAVEDVVTQYQSGRLITDEVCTQHESLSQAVGFFLYGVGQVYAQLRAVA